MAADSAMVTAKPDPACGPYILWLDYGCEGWKPESFPTLTQALSADRYGNRFVVTKIIDFYVVEKSPIENADDHKEIDRLKTALLQIRNFAGNVCFNEIFLRT